MIDFIAYGKINVVTSYNERWTMTLQSVRENLRWLDHNILGLRDSKIA